MRSSPTLEAKIGHRPLRVISAPNFVEYRLEKPYARGQSKSSSFLDSGWTLVEGCHVLCIAYLWSQESKWGTLAIASSLIALLYWRCTRVLWESVFVFPPHGVQLETHRGLPSYPLSVSRKFIPTIYLQDVVINEGLCGWNVRYYLAFMETSPNGLIELRIGFKNILPHFAVLLEVYRGVLEHLHVDDDPQPA